MRLDFWEDEVFNVEIFIGPLENGIQTAHFTYEDLKTGKYVEDEIKIHTVSPIPPFGLAQQVLTSIKSIIRT